MELYLLQVICYTGSLWLIYRIVLRPVTNHLLTRIFLWLAMILPFILPFLKWDLFKDAPPAAFSYTIAGFVLQHSGKVKEVYMRDAGHWPEIIYSIIAVFLLVRLAVKHIQFRAFLKRQGGLLYKGSRILTDTGIGPGSYGRSVFLPDATVNETIIAHELAHIRYGHHYDLLLQQLLQCFCWINPFLYVIHKDLKLVHEYEADAAAAREDKHQYINVLLNEALSTTYFSIAHSFFHHPIKKNRIMMLQKNTGRTFNTGRFLLAVMFTGILAVGTSQAQTSSRQESAVNSNGDTVLKVVEQMPEFNGNLSAWLRDHLNYPDTASRAGVKGRVGIKFIVNKTGKVTNVTVVKSSGSEVLDNEALRVVRTMPPWLPGKSKGKPVNVYFTLPIVFQLEG